MKDTSMFFHFMHLKNCHMQNYHLQSTSNYHKLDEQKIDIIVYTQNYIINFSTRIIYNKYYHNNKFYAFMVYRN